MRVLGVLGGRPVVPEVLQIWADAADHIYGADSGADSLLQLGIKPVVVGDLDSVQSDLSGLRVVKDNHPDFSDCDKMLNLIKAEVDQPELVITGLEGDRLDHMLGSLSSIFAANFPCRILLDTGMAYPLQGGETLSLPQHQGNTVSLIPFGDSVASMLNCTWPLTEKKFKMGEFHSLSNIAEEGFEVRLTSGIALLIVTGQFDPW